LRLVLLATLLSVAVVLVFAEGLQRLSDWRKEVRRAERKDPYALLGVTPEGDPIYGDTKRGQMRMELTPHMLFATRPDQQLQGVRINAQGFRGADWNVARRPGVRRVIALGGSTAFGKEAHSDDRTWAADLERRLSESAPTEVLNAGVIAFDSNQERILLASRLLQYSPDLLIFFDGWNDFFNGGLARDGYGLQPPHFWELVDAIHRGQQVFRNVLRLSAFYRSVEEKLPGWRLALGLDEPVDRGYGRFEYRPEAVARYGRNLELMIRLGRAYGAASLVVTQPEIFQRRVPTDYEQHKRDQLELDGYADYARAHYAEYAAIARTVAAAEGVPFVVTDGIFDDLEGEVFTDLVHLTEHGQRKVAEVLAEPVERALRAHASRGAADRSAR
jgi:lysophospholipase L1-like esterase